MKIEDQIQDYLNGQLSLKERIKLESDPAFMLLLKEWQAVEKAINPTSKVNQFRQLTEAVIDNNKPKHRFPIWAMAAGFLLIFGLAFWVLNTRQSTDQFFQNHYQALFLNSITRDGAEDKSVPLFIRQLNDFYTTKNYQAACDLMVAWADEDDFTPSATYYIRTGELLLLNEQPIKALQYLEKVTNGYPENLVWLKAWAFYNSGQPDKAEELFNSIVQSKGSFQKEAKAVLQNW